MGRMGTDGNRQRMKRMRMVCRLMPLVGGILAGCAGIVFLVSAAGKKETETVWSAVEQIPIIGKSHIEPIVSAAEEFPDLNIREAFLTENPYSRPGTELGDVEKIVIHYTGNPGTTAQANRDYFESLGENPVTSASSHFVIGLDGEILQCIPLNEVAYASNEANAYSISIECCHPDADGEFTVATYNQCVALAAELCRYYHLNSETDVIRHYDVTGKECPLYYVENPQEWDMFLGFIKDRLS